MYHILNYSIQKAKQLCVDIKPSTRKNKKIDVYKNNKYICSIGDINYSDYPHYLLKDFTLAKKRQILYHQRHQKQKNTINTAGYYAYHILW